MSEAEIAYSVDHMLLGFDVESNEIDRRIYYEVTGSRQFILEGDFYDFGDSSCDEEWADSQRPADPLASFLE